MRLEDIATSLIFVSTLSQCGFNYVIDRHFNLSCFMMVEAEAAEHESQCPAVLDFGSPTIFHDRLWSVTEINAESAPTEHGDAVKRDLALVEAAGGLGVVALAYAIGIVVVGIEVPVHHSTE